MPKSAAATSKEQRVRVLVFSKIKATFLPSCMRWAIWACFFSFSSAAKSNKYVISSGVKSSSVKKLRPCKFMPFPPPRKPL